MQIPTLRSAALPLALLPLTLALLTASRPAQAQQQALYVQATAGTATYQYNTLQGVVAASGNGSGTAALGAPEAWAAASSDEGSGAFHGIQAASASADYATAGLHAAVFTDLSFSRGSARAQLNDGIVFHTAGGDASTVTHIGLDLTLTGTISEMQNVSYLFDLKMSTQGGGLSAGWTTALYDTPDDPRNYVGWAVSGGTGAPDGFDSWELVAGTATEKHLHGVFSFTGAQKAYDLIMGFGLTCAGGTDCDFGNSGHLSFVLPDGVTMTSTSGLLLTGTAPVPEPQAYTLMLGGLALMGWLSRRRLMR